MEVVSETGSDSPLPLASPVSVKLSPETVQVAPQERVVTPLRSAGTVTRSPAASDQQAQGLPFAAIARSAVLFTLAGGFLFISLYLSGLGRRKRT